MDFENYLFVLISRCRTLEQALMEIMMSEEYQEYCLNKNIEEVEETVFRN